MLRVLSFDQAHELRLGLMIKKLVLIVVVLCLVCAQAFFIYALQHGAASEFEGLWRGFGLPQSEYSQLVFRTIKWWWSLPAFCLVLLALALWRNRKLHTTAVLLASFIGTVALYWSAYAPSLFVDV